MRRAGQGIGAPGGDLGRRAGRLDRPRWVCTVLSVWPGVASQGQGGASREGVAAPMRMTNTGLAAPGAPRGWSLHTPAEQPPSSGFTLYSSFTHRCAEHLLCEVLKATGHQVDQNLPSHRAKD